MTKNNNDDIFLKYSEGIKPIKKTNRITKPIPKQKLEIKKTKEIKKKTTHKVFEKTKSFILPSEKNIQKNYINKKLKKGKIQINKKVDFHGCSLEEAKKLFLNTIFDCFIKNYRCILFITGKGLNQKKTDIFQEKKLYYGKIRNEFLHWVSAQEVRSKILNVQQANLENGGDGAFFVYLRKNKN